MKILVVSDHEEGSLYKHFDPDRWVGKVQLVISCGDLRSEYLSYLVTVLAVPLLYVAGNHDRSFHTQPPEGCDDIDGKLVRIEGLRILGLAGCLRYNSGEDDYQYTERRLRWRIRALMPTIWRAGGIDLVVSHAAPLRCPTYRQYHLPPTGLGRVCGHPELPGHPAICPEAIDPAHRGVSPYNDAIDHWKPRWWVHGHNHLEYGRIPRLWWIQNTQVINADGHVVVDTSQAADAGYGSLVRGM